MEYWVFVSPSSVLVTYFICILYKYMKLIVVRQKWEGKKNSIRAFSDLSEKKVFVMICWFHYIYCLRTWILSFSFSWQNCYIGTEKAVWMILAFKKDGLFTGKHLKKVQVIETVRRSWSLKRDTLKSTLQKKKDQSKPVPFMGFILAFCPMFSFRLFSFLCLCGSCVCFISFRLSDRSHPLIE